MKCKTSCNDNDTLEILIDKREVIGENEAYKSNKCKFLVAGRMIYRKGHNVLLDALKCIPLELQYECRIVGDGPELKRLKSRCNKLGLSDRVIFIGKVPFEEMTKEYINADVFIMPSIRETSGAVLLEAMSKSIPIVTMNKFGGAILLDENTAWLYDGFTMDECVSNLKDALIDCIKYPNDVILKGRNARKAAEKYIWHEKNKHYNEIYEKLILKNN